MNKENELKYYLSVSPNKYGIYLFDTKNLINLYKDEIILNNDTNYQNYNELKKFLDDNIFKIEKKLNSFIKDIYVILDSKEFHSIKLSIKKDNNGNLINSEALIHPLSDLKNLCQSNLFNKKIIAPIEINESAILNVGQ